MVISTETPTDTQSKIVKLDVRTDIKNPSNLPWKYKNESIDELMCAGVLEFIPGKLRGKIMDEIYRVLKPTGKAAITVAYWNSAMGIQDYRYEWPPIAEQSFLYFNKGWRDANKLELDLKCDFDFTYGYTAEAETAARNEESRSFNIKHYTNCVNALHVMLTKHLPDKK